MNLIDTAMTREQFDAFDAEVVTMLCDATQSDLEQWSQRLLRAWETDDHDGVERACHALRGVCGNYGAQALISLSAGPLREAGDRDRLNLCVEQTIAAIRSVASASATD